MPTLLGFSITILYIILSSKELSSYLKLGLILIGIISLYYFSFLIESANEKKIHKYKICNEIEKKYGFTGNHLGVSRLYISEYKFNGMVILRMIKGILFFIYLLSIAIIYWNWDINLQIPGFLALFMANLILLLLILEQSYNKISTR